MKFIKVHKNTLENWNTKHFFCVSILFPSQLLRNISHEKKNNCKYFSYIWFTLCLKKPRSNKNTFKNYQQRIHARTIITKECLQCLSFIRLNNSSKWMLLVCLLEPCLVPGLVPTCVCLCEMWVIIIIIKREEYHLIFNSTCFIVEKLL